MGKKKHAEHVNHERWLVSYADLLTLLFAFFVVLFASSVSDKKKTAAMAAAMQSAFSDSGAFDAHSNTPPLEPGAGNSQGAPMPLMTPLPTAEAAAAANTAARQVQASIQRAIANDALRGSTTVRVDREGTTISLSDAGLFASGSSDLSAAALPLLRKIAAELPNRAMRIEGHTDDQPIHSDRFRSNFELSTARAAAVAEVILRSGRIGPSHLALAGYGEFRPVADNSSAAGRAQNRRVDIVVTNASESTAKLSPPEGVRAAAPVMVAVHQDAPVQQVRTHAEQLAPSADKASAH